MIKLPNDCRCSNLSVFPKNWQSHNPKTNIDWYISYRFYDPRHEKPRQIVIKRMNKYKTVSDRQNDVVEILKEEMEKLSKGFNPFYRNSSPILKDEEKVTLIQALDSLMHISCVL